MSITKLDYKFQGSNLKNAVIDVISRYNATSGRYTKGGFKLDFYADDYEIENFRWIIERADIADKKIREAALSGKDIDNLEVLKVIAEEVDQNIKKGKKDGSPINYIVYLLIPIVIIIFLFFI